MVRSIVLKLLLLAATCLIQYKNLKAQQLGEPVCSHSSGYYGASIQVSLSHGVPGVQIRYTTDGSEPTTNSTLYAGPISFNDITTAPNNLSSIPTNPSFTYPIGDYDANRANTRGWLPPSTTVYKANILRAKAYKSGYTPSESATRTYIIDTLTVPPFALPVLSIVADSTDLFADDSGIWVYGNHPDGNYNQTGTLWEKEVHFELFDAGFTSMHAQSARGRAHGGGSRHSCKKNLRLYGNSGLSTTFDFQLPPFPDTERKKFKRLLIRAGGHRPDCLPRDDLANAITKGLKADQQHYKWVVLLINGEYWGIYSIKERVDRFFFEGLYGVDDNFITVLDHDKKIDDSGNPQDSIEMEILEAYVENSNMNTQSSFDYVNERMDLNSYIDYMAGEIFLANHDWVYSNVTYWRKSGGYDPDAYPGHDGKFRWCFYDFDGGFGGSCGNVYYTSNTLGLATDSTGTFSSYSEFFRGLLKNDVIRNRFINRTADLLNSWFKPNVVASKVNDFYNQLTPEMMRNIERWRYPSTATTLTSRQNEVPNLWRWDTTFTLLNKFANRRPRKIREHYMAYWSLTDTFNVSVNVNDYSMGRVQVNSLLLNNEIPGVSASVYPWQGKYFSQTTVPIIAVPLPGYRFVEWQGTGNTSDTIYWSPSADTSLTAVFSLDPSYSPLRINELMAANSSFIYDNFDQADDWLEIYNPNNYPINLSECAIVKDFNYWQIPSNTVVDANGYLVFWHDGDTYQGNDHASFKLTNSPGLVYLKSANGSTLDTISYPATLSNKSYGRYPNGSMSFTVFDSPTPRFNNDWTSIPEAEESYLNVYPNPSTGQVFFSEKISGTILDINGRKAGTITNESMSDLSYLKGGVYFLHAYSGQTIKLVIISGN